MPAKPPPSLPKHRPRPARRVVVPFSVNSQAQRSDFRQLMAFVRAHAWYAGETDLDRLAAIMEPLAASAPDTDAFLRVLERTLGHLGDPLARLGREWWDSPRAVPHDLMAEWEGPKAVLRAVKVRSAAWNAGLRPGQVVTAVDGVGLEDALAERRPLVRAATADTESWTLNALLAGRRGQSRKITVLAGGESREVEVADRQDLQLPKGGVSYRMLRVGVAYLRIPTFAGPATAREVDLALDQVRGVDGLILDLRDNPGGDPAAVRTILGRFTAKHQTVPEVGAVPPRGSWTFKRPVVVLVDAWTQGAAELAAAGLEQLGRGTLVGTATAGLVASPATTTLAHAKVQVQVGAVAHPTLTGRKALRPRIGVDLGGAGAGDPVLEAGLRTLDELLGGGR